jgi:hypothetical protein
MSSWERMPGLACLNTRSFSKSVLRLIGLMCSPSVAEANSPDRSRGFGWRPFPLRIKYCERISDPTQALRISNVKQVGFGALDYCATVIPLKQTEKYI